METSIPAFLPDGTMVTLIQVLSRVDGDGLVWRMLEFDGTTVPGSGIDVHRLDRDIKADPDGLVFTWDSLLSFADRVYQTIDCTLQAFRNTARVLEIEAFDSAERLIWADDNDPAAVRSAQRVTEIGGSPLS